MPGMPRRWMSCCCFGVISRFSQTKPFFDDSRSRTSPVSRSGKRRGQKLDRLVLVDDAARLAEQARRLDVGREDFAVAVDDIRPRGGDRVLRGGAARAVTIGADREHHEPPGDDGIDHGKSQHRKPDAGARLRGAIDIAPVKQAADQPLPQRFDRPWSR